MIDGASFSKEHIQSIKGTSKRDPGLIERVIFAFGLLEAIRSTELPFIFKGGTSLMLLTDSPKRFSTDIDIIVAPDASLDSYLEKAVIWPFTRIEEQKRHKTSGINKRHFKYMYNSPLKENEFHIILDVLFEDNHYPSLVSKNIQNDLLITKAPYIQVDIPNANGLLGDKLTAFAPHTTGIRYDHDKELEIIKQLFDIATLISYIDNFQEVKDTYMSVSRAEIGYRGLSLDPTEALRDTIDTAMCVAGKGLVRAEEYTQLFKGIRNISNHIYSERFNQDSATKCACVVMHLAAAILSKQEVLPILKGFDFYSEITIKNPAYNKLNYIKKLDIMSYAYLIETLIMLNNL
jgi:hypothetical protein